MHGRVQAADPLEAFEAEGIRIRRPLQVRVGGDFASTRRWIHRLHRGFAWSVCVDETDCATRMLGSFVPDRLNVKSLEASGAITPHVLWDPFQKKKARKKTSMACAWASRGDDSDPPADDDEVGSAGDSSKKSRTSDASISTSSSDSSTTEHEETVSKAVCGDNEQDDVTSDGSSGDSVRGLEEEYLAPEHDAGPASDSESSRSSSVIPTKSSGSGGALGSDVVALASAAAQESITAPANRCE